MAIPIPLPEGRKDGRKEGSHGLCLSPLEKRRSVVIVTSFLLPEGKTEGKREGGYSEGSHGLCLSPLENRRSVVMVTLMPLPTGRREGGHGLSLSLPGELFQKEGGQEAMTSALLILRSGGGEAMAPPHRSSRRKE